MSQMMTRLYRVLPLLALTMLMAGCDLIGDVLEFGFWTAVIILVLIIALVWWVVRKLGAGRRGPPPPPA